MATRTQILALAIHFCGRTVYRVVCIWFEKMPGTVIPMGEGFHLSLKERCTRAFALPWSLTGLWTFRGRCRGLVGVPQFRHLQAFCDRACGVARRRVRAGVGVARRQGGMRALRALTWYPRRDGALGVVLDTAGFRTRLMACSSLRFNGLRRFRATGPGWVLGLGMGLGLAGLQGGL